MNVGSDVSDGLTASIFMAVYKEFYFVTEVSGDLTAFIFRANAT